MLDFICTIIMYKYSDFRNIFANNIGAMERLKKLTVKDSSTIREGLEAIDRGLLGISLVVDDEFRLIATVTDGDIRRALIRGASLEDHLSTIMTLNPIKAKVATSNNDLISVMKSKGITQIPIVDHNNKLVDVKSLSTILKGRVKDNYLIIMAGGLGTRLRPLTNSTPKPLLPIGNKPILESIIEHAESFGLVNIMISINYMSESIVNYFGDGSKYGVKIDYVFEKESMGTAGSLALVDKEINDDVFVINGDILTRVNFDEMLSNHKKAENYLTVGTRPYNTQIPYGILKLDGEKISSIEEKPTLEYIINAGIYTLSPEAVKMIPKGEFFHMTHLMEKLLKEKKNLGSFLIEDYWLDIGKINDYYRANAEYNDFFRIGINMKDKKVLVTGAGGFIGSHLVERLVKDGASVKALVHYNSRNDYGLIHQLDKEIRDSIEIIFSDITDNISVFKSMKGIDVVFHLAALIGIPYSYYSPNSYVETNIRGTLNILNSARELETSKVVHTSTSEVYGTALYAPIDEKHPLQGQSPYSATKIGADKLAESYYLSFGLPVATIRPFNTFGPRQSLRAVIPTIITQALKGDVVNLGNLDTVRDFNYVKDTVSGFITIAQNEVSNGKVINIGSGKAVTIGNVVELVSKILEKPLNVNVQDERLRPDKSEVYKLLCDNKLANDLLGWKPDYTFEDGLNETVEWFKSNNIYNNTDMYVV